MDYSTLCGWADRPKDVEKVVACQAIPIFSNILKDSGKGKTITLWQFIEQVTGQPFKPRFQEIGDCVSMGAALAVDIVKATQSVLLKTYEDWVAETATEPIYWLSRCEIGRFQLRGSDGSTGGWAAEAVKQYGTLARNKYGSFNLTKYSGRMASMYADKGCPDELETFSKEHKIKYVSLIQTWEDVRDAVANGYPITIASNRGFTNKRDKDGFASPKGKWPHQMCIAGIKDDNRPGALIINSWGSDWISGPKFLQPEGSFWCDADVLERSILSANDSWVFSGFEGYPPQKINWDII